MVRSRTWKVGGRSRFGLSGRIACLALLVGFLAHAGDGVMAALCHPGMGAFAGATVAVHGDDSHPDAQLHHDHGDHPEGETPAHDDPCPFGGASLAVCGGVATVPPLATPAGLGPVLVDAPRPAAFAAAHGALLSLKLFRPPRA